jgi:hypothetical protein
MNKYQIATPEFADSGSTITSNGRSGKFPRS